MKIKQIHIDDFGKFSNFDLHLDEGLNVIYGENESGKSTLMNFILMMFYGTSSRKKGISDNLRIKYKPWNSREMKGYIIFDFEGVSYRLERTFAQTNNKDVVKLIDNATGTRIPVLNELAPGEHFFGMSQEAFTKSLFIDSEDLSFSSTNANDITQKLRNMISTSDEEVSIENSIRLLEEKQFLLKTKRGDKGLLIDTQARIDELRSELSKAKSDEMEKLSLQNDIIELESALEIEKLRKHNHTLEREIERVKTANDRNDERKLLEKKLGEYDEKKSFLTGLLRANEFYLEESSSNLEGKKTEKSKIIAQIDMINSKIYAKEKSSITAKRTHSLTKQGFLFSSILLGILGIILLLLKSSTIMISVSLVLALACLLIYIYLKRMTFKDTYNDDIDNPNDLLDIKKQEYSILIDDISILEKRIQDVKLQSIEYKLELNNLEENNRDRKEALENIRKDRSAIALNPKIIENNQKQLDRLKAEVEEKEVKHIQKFGRYDYFETFDDEQDRLIKITSEYERKKAYANERFKNSRYVDEINAKINNHTKVLLDYQNEYESIKVAVDQLKKSSHSLMRDFNPILNKKTQEVFSRLTGGRYEKVMVSSEFGISFEDQDRNEIKEWDFLSSGAKDQAYISLKIALALLINTMKDPILFLDDIFVKFDESRAKEGLDFLLDLQKDFSQIILFTCHKRIFDMVNDATNKISL